MAVKSIMSSPVITVQLDDTLATVNDIFNNTPFHHLLVVENKKLLGVVSDRDLLKALSPNIGTAAERPKDSATLNKKVHQIMSRKPIAINQEHSVHQVIDIFEAHNISCVPVVDNYNTPVGIVSWRDLFKAIRKPNK